MTIEMLLSHRENKHKNFQNSWNAMCASQLLLNYSIWQIDARASKQIRFARLVDPEHDDFVEITQITL